MINDAYFDKIASLESGNDPIAKNPKSSAKGRYQFIDSTAKQYGIDAPLGTPEYERQENEAIKKFTIDNYNFLEKELGRKPTNGELYLAHQQGAQGAVDLIMQPNKKAIDVVGKDAVEDNGGNSDMLASEFSNKWQSKLNDLDAEESKLAPSVNLYDLIDNKTGENLSAQPNQINLYDLMQTNDEFVAEKNKESRIDNKTGAPSFVRAAVGSVYDEGDRLETIKKYYPDATPYGKDNFLFTNPETGKKTLYNPRGLDWGDTASIAREAVVTVGSGVGAAVGFVVGTGSTGVGGVPMAMAGSGVGAATTGSFYDRMVEYFGVTVDTRSFGQKVADYALEGAAATVGEGLGRAVAPLAKKALGGGTIAAKNILETFKQFDITPALPVVTKSRGMGIVEAGLKQIPSAADVIGKQTDEIVVQTKNAVSKIIARYGEPSSFQETGEIIQKAAVKAGERIGFRQESLYQEAYDAMGDGAVVQVDSIKSLYQSMIGELNKAPKALAPKLKPTLDELGAIIADAGDNGMDFSALRQVRTAIGRDLGKSHLMSGSEEAVKKRVYAAVSEDLGNAASQYSDEAAHLMKRADRYTRRYETQYKEYLTKIINTDGEEKAYLFAMRSNNYGNSTLKKLKTVFTPEEWDMVAASTLDKMGLATKGMQNAKGDAFSINTFLTNWNKMSPEARNTLFNSKRHKDTYQALNKLTDLMGSLKEVGRSANTSNTSGAIATMMMLQGLGGGIVGLSQDGDATQVATTAIGAVIAPRVAAKLLTNPKFIDWLAEPVTANVFSMSDHLGKLMLISEANDDLREPVREYIKTLSFITREEKE